MLMTTPASFYDELNQTDVIMMERPWVYSCQVSINQFAHVCRVIDIFKTVLLFNEPGISSSKYESSRHLCAHQRTTEWATAS